MGSLRDRLPLGRAYGLTANANGICCYSRAFSFETGDVLRVRRGDVKRRLPTDNRDKFSKRSAKRLKVKINGLLYMVDKSILLAGRNRHKVVFATLTLPSAQCHSDTEIKSKCLNQLLTELRSVYGRLLYVWKAERQKNGNLHFHLLLNRYIPSRELRDRWNRILSKLGYIDAFEAKHGHRDPNSTDIHSLYRDKKTGKRVVSVVSYMAKYMSKEGDTIEGRYWYASKELSAIDKITLCSPDIDDKTPIFEEFGRLCLDMRAKDSGRVLIDDYFTFVCISLSELQAYPLLFARYNEVFDMLCAKVNL